MIKQRKWIGVLMVLVMVFAMVPTLAFGEDTPGEPEAKGIIKPMAFGDEISDGTWTAKEGIYGTYYISKYDGPKLAEITIPAEVAGVKVTGIIDCFNVEEGSDANTWLKKVTFDSNITKTDRFSMSSAFRGCTMLEEVELPADTDMYMAGCFYDCTALTTINLQDLKNVGIGSSTFANCTSLQSVRLPAGTTHFGDNGFMGSGLEEIDLEGIRIIGSSVFENAKLKNTPGKTLPDSDEPCLYIPDSVTQIYGKAFAGDSHQYTAVSVPKGLSTTGVFKAGVPIEVRETVGMVSVSYNEGFSNSTDQKGGEYPENDTYTVDCYLRFGNVGWIPLGSDGTLKMDEFYENEDKYQLGTEDVVFYGVKDLNPVMKHPKDVAKDKRVRETPIYGNYQFPADVTVSIPEYPADADWQDAIPVGKVFDGWKYSYTEKIIQPGDTHLRQLSIPCRCDRKHPGISGRCGLAGCYPCRKGIRRLEIQLHRKDHPAGRHHFHQRGIFR